MKVALLAEGVDRNQALAGNAHLLGKVALLAEGVDRNIFVFMAVCRLLSSPSSRRAWIEIKLSSEYTR